MIPSAMSDPSRFRRIAVIDIGKTNAKVVVVDARTGAEIAARRTPNAPLRAPPYPHYDVDRLWQFITDALRDLALEPGFDALSITTHGAAAALVGADGALALPVLDYEHAYPADIAIAYDGLRPAFSETSSPRLATGLNLGAQLHYQKTAFPEAFAHVRTIMTYPQYWAFRLTGVAANEVTSLGCHTDLWNPGEGRYSSLGERLGIAELMAPVRSAFDPLGPVSPDIAADLGLAADVPVYCGIHDSNASLLPHLIENEPPFSVVSTGTWVICFGVGGDLAHLDPARDTLANVDAYGRAVPSSRFMGGREFETVAADLGAFEHVAAEGAVAAVVDKGMMLLPNIAEGTGPFPGKISRWIASENASTAERYAALGLYLALMTEACLQLIGAHGAIFVEGPFAHNRLYRAALATLTGRDVIALPGSTGTSQGAALLTGIAAFEKHPVGSAETLTRRDLGAYREAWYAAMGEQVR